MTACCLSVAEDVKNIEKKDAFNPNEYYVSLTSHAEQFGVEPVRIRVRTTPAYAADIHCEDMGTDLVLLVM